MLIVELDQKTLSSLRDKTRLRGGIQRMVDATGIHRTTIARVRLLGTATEEVAEKLGSYLTPEKKARKSIKAAA